MNSHSYGHDHAYRWWFHPAQPGFHAYYSQPIQPMVPYNPSYTQAPWPNNTWWSEARQYTTFQDYGPQPFTIDIDEAVERNNNFRNTLWTGKHLQLTLMSIPVGEDIGLEVHPNVDQFLRIEEGHGVVRMGSSEDSVQFQRSVEDGDVILVPAGTWHNVINTGNSPLKLYTIYAPPEHPHGTVHRTKAEAMAAEGATRNG